MQTGQLVDAQLKLRAELGLPEKVIEVPEQDTTLLDKARELFGADLSAALVIAGKQERHDRVNELKDALKEKLLELFPEMTDEDFFQMFDKLEIELVSTNVLEHGKRIDGRAMDELRPLAITPNVEMTPAVLGR